jgi:YwiC-like protein
MKGKAAAPALAWRPVALPVEHGAWSFLLEPVILGLSLAPSLAGLSLGIAALAGFLVRHPLRLVALDRGKGARHARTGLAQRFAFSYAAAAFLFASAAFVSAERGFILPILTAAPLALGALLLDLRGRGRDLAAEIAGSVALGASATAIVMAGGGSHRAAWMAWLFLALRSVTAIVYVRARLARERGGVSPVFGVMALHVVVIFVVAGLTLPGLAPVAAVAAFAILLLRAAHGLLLPPKGVRPQVVGISEVVFGLITLALLWVGFRPAR